MKKFNKYIALALGALALTSCEDLDTEYLGYYVTTDQKQNTLEQNPEMAQAGVTGIFASLNKYGQIYGTDAHFDFGYPAIMIGLDLQGADMISVNSGYNHFNYWEGFTSPTAGGTPSGMAWYNMYDQVFSANAVAATIPADTEDDLLKFYRAQAVGARAFDYWVLAQLYQFNYAGNEDKPCVPIITDENSEEAAANGCPRASVAETYAQILKDINEAIELLNATTYTPEQVIDSKPKRMISKAVAYGLQARVYLTMHKYAEAATAAQNAIGSFSGRPFSIAEVSVPTFTSIDEPSWMWGIAMAETDRPVTTGICNFPSMMGSFCYGYCTVGAWKWLNMKVYDEIPASDVRKGWFLDENLDSKNLNASQKAYLSDFESSLEAYTQVKFGPYKGVLGQTTNACDIPLMRIEEMYYILAEGQAMSGNVAAAKTTLENFVKTYRDPKFAVADGISAEDFQDLVYQQRRVEFFGEGLSWFDIMRLNKVIDRTNSNFPPAFSFYIEPNDPCRIYCIPTGEINGNPQISDADNNKEGTRPSPVA